MILLFDDIITGENIQYLCDITLITKDILNFHKSLKKNIHMSFLDNSYIDIDTIKKCKTIFVYTQIFNLFKEYVLPYLDSNKCYNIVTHNSDNSIDDTYINILNNYNIRMFSQNVNIRHNSIFSIPIGIANEQWNHGNKNILLEIINYNSNTLLSNKIDKIYTNFSINTYPQYRQYVYNSLSKYEFSYIIPNRNNYTFMNYKDYLLDMSKYKWISCPRGNGIDCHRIWEALYLSCIPLVDRNINTEYYNDLPIIYIDNWDKIDFIYLKNETEKIINNLNNYNYNKLYLKHWKYLLEK
jgi:hypothetical protein